MCWVPSAAFAAALVDLSGAASTGLTPDSIPHASPRVTELWTPVVSSESRLRVAEGVPARALLIRA
jgi:hypothetical protein